MSFETYLTVFCVLLMLILI